MSEQEAEDVVSEVLLRAAEASPMDGDALARWLTTVTINVCADLAREHARSGKRAVYSMRLLTPEPSPEQLVLDRETAATAVRRLSRLPERQRNALLLRSAGFGINEIARELDVSYKTAESLLSRARAFMRKAVVLGGAILVTVLRGLRRNTKVAPVLAAAMLALILGTNVWILRPPAPDVPGATKSRALTVHVLGHPGSNATGKRAHGTTARANSRQPPTSEQHATPPPRITLVKSTTIRKGRTYVKTPRVSYGHADETFLQTTNRCLRDVQISASRIGCPP